MADLWPANGAIHIPPRVASCYLGPDADQDDGGDMDIEDRLRAVEMASQRNNDKIDGHERECALRYAQVLEGQKRIETKIAEGQKGFGTHLKYLTWAVGGLAMVVLGVATVNDIVRSGAARIGVTVQAAPNPPNPPNPPNAPNPPYPYPR